MEAWWALAAVGAGLLVGTVVTAARPASAVPDRAGFAERWRRAHGGYDPTGSRVVGGWLAVTYTVARPLAAVGVKPDVLTAWTVWLAAAVVGVASLDGAWPAAAALLLVASGLLDALDGAVAVLTDRASRWGYVLDSLADRASDLLYVAALWVVGAPGWLAAATGAGVLLLEYARARGANAGAGEIGVVTVAERPTRVIAVAATLLAVGAAAVAVPAPAEWPLATAGLGVLALLTAVGIAQLLMALRRAL